MRHLITRAGDGRWPRYQVKSLACPGCEKNIAVQLFGTSGQGKGVPQEIFGRRIQRLSCVVICYHVNSLV